MSAAPALPTRGWTAFQHFFFEDVLRKLSGRRLEYSIVLNIWDKTAGGKVGKEGRPEWCRITHAQFAHWGYATVDGVSKAIRRLEVSYKDRDGEMLPLIEQRKTGRQLEYRLLVDNFDLLPEPLPPTKDEPEPDAANWMRIPRSIVAKLCKICRPLFEFEHQETGNIDSIGDARRKPIRESGYPKQTSGEAISTIQDQPIDQPRGERGETSDSVQGAGNDVKSPAPRRGLRKEVAGNSQSNRGVPPHEAAPSRQTEGETCSDSVQNSVANLQQAVDDRFFTPESLELLLVQVVMPQVISEPPTRVLKEMLEILDKVPRIVFEKRLSIRLKKVTGWGMVRDLANDARAAQLKLQSHFQEVIRDPAADRRELVKQMAECIRSGHEEDAIFTAGDDEAGKLLLAEARELTKVQR